MGDSRLVLMSCDVRVMAVSFGISRSEISSFFGLFLINTQRMLCFWITGLPVEVSA